MGKSHINICKHYISLMDQVSRRKRNYNWSLRSSSLSQKWSSDSRRKRKYILDPIVMKELDDQQEISSATFGKKWKTFIDFRKLREFLQNVPLKWIELSQCSFIYHKNLSKHNNPFQKSRCIAAWKIYGLKWKQEGSDVISDGLGCWLDVSRNKCRI